MQLNTQTCMEKKLKGHFCTQTLPLSHAVFLYPKLHILHSFGVKDSFFGIIVRRVEICY